MPAAPLTYQTGLVVGRAFAIANGPRTDPRGPEELHDLAAGDRAILAAARERFSAFVQGQPDSSGDARALELVDAALALSPTAVPMA